MTPAEVLAIIDAALTIAERGPSILAGMLQRGEITVEQQQERLNRIAASRALSGHVSPTPPSSG